MPNNGNRNDRRISRFADLVAEGKTITETGRELGLTKGQTANCWRTIKADMGAQAV